MLTCAVALGAEPQTKATVHEPDTNPNRDDWKKQPYKVAVGKVLGQTCAYLTLKTDNSSLRLGFPEQWTIHTPAGKRLANPAACNSMEGMRVRVTYTPNKENGFDGEFHEIEVLSGNPGLIPEPHSPKPKGQSVLADKLAQRATAEGKVTAVTCTGQQLFVVLDLGGFTLKLHSDNYRDAAFYVPGVSESYVFDPCKRLKGRRAKIEYVVVKGKSYGGEVVSVEVED